MTDTKGAVSALDKNSGATIWKQDKLLGAASERAGADWHCS